MSPSSRTALRGGTAPCCTLPIGCSVLTKPERDTQLPGTRGDRSQSLTALQDGQPPEPLRTDSEQEVAAARILQRAWEDSSSSETPTRTRDTCPLSSGFLNVPTRSASDAWTCTGLDRDQRMNNQARRGLGLSYTCKRSPQFRREEGWNLTWDRPPHTRGV